jgi:hypothetical protein
MRCSRFSTITRPNGTRVSDFAREWRLNSFVQQLKNRLSGCFSNFSYALAGDYGIQETTDETKVAGRPSNFD